MGPTINRINYGAIFKSTSEHSLQVAAAKLVFIINLPQIINAKRPNVSYELMNGSNTSLYHRIFDFINHIHELDFLAHKTLYVHMKQIRQLTSNFDTKSKRSAWIGGLGINQSLALCMKMTLLS